MSVKIRRGDYKDVQLSSRLMDVPVGLGLPTVDSLWLEIADYVDILLGRKESPVNSPYLSLAECATAYYSRAQEIDQVRFFGRILQN